MKTPNPGTIAEKALAAHPVGFVPARAIGRIMGVSDAVILDAARKYVEGRPIGNAYIGFPAQPGSLRPLLKAWGIDRTREWLAVHFPAVMDTFEARTAKDSAGNFDPVPSTRSHHANGSVVPHETPKERARNLKLASTLRRLTDVLQRHPVGLVPDGLIGAVTGFNDTDIKAWRHAKGVTPYSLTGNRFPFKPGSFMRLIVAWDVDRSRTWVESYAKDLVPMFERDAGPRKALTRAETVNETIRAATCGSSLQRAAEVVRKPMFVPKWEGGDADEKRQERERIAAALVEFRARKAITICPPAGWGDGARPVHVADVFGGMDAE